MAITVNGQIYRNLQEQVQYLTDSIEKIKPYVAGTGITISGQTIAIDSNTNLRITTAQAAAVQAQNRADSAYDLANTAKIATEQNTARIQTLENTAPQFSLEGTTLTITLPA